jgi:hypothetical protein
MPGVLEMKPGPRSRYIAGQIILDIASFHPRSYLFADLDWAKVSLGERELTGS